MTSRAVNETTSLEGDENDDGDEADDDDDEDDDDDDVLRRWQ